MNHKDRALTRLAMICSLCLSISWAAPALSDEVTSGIFKFQSKLAASGNPQAQYKLGTMYETGRGVTASTDEALEWYKKSAAQNFKPASDRSTYLEVKKSGFNADVHGPWLNDLKQSAAAENGEAMLLLGQLYKDGIGVPRDLNKARTMFSGAAKKDVSGTDIELENTQALINSEQKKASAQKKRDAATKLKAQQQAVANKKQQIAKKQAKEKQHQAKLKAAQQQKIALDRQKLEAEKLKFEAEKRKLAKQQQMLKQQQLQKQRAAQAAAKAKAEDEDKGFEKDACKGPKAKFLTVCQ